MGRRTGGEEPLTNQVGGFPHYFEEGGALKLKGYLVYGCAVSTRLPTSFLICCSKAFYDGAWLDNASVGS